MSASGDILVTGAAGFIGSAVLSRLAATSPRLRPISRSARPGYRQVETIDGQTRWADHLAGVSAVIHLAARVHVMREPTHDPLTAFRRVNVDGTLNLARQAAAAGVRRFVFVSSIKVNGEATVEGRPFLADDLPAPQDPYGISKYEAEVGLRHLAAESGLEVVVIRPVLVYGPGVGGNFRTMMRWIEWGIPLPLAALHNRRSLVAVDNIADLIAVCAHHADAASRTFLVSDGEDVSTPDLLRRIAAAMQKSVRLLPVPPKALTAAAALVGRADLTRRLCGSLQVDISHTERTLGWKPRVTLDHGLRLAAEAFLARKTS